MQAKVKAASTVQAHITALAGQCVKCGLCLPHCPTYRLAGTEAESPRGRIAFAQALAERHLGATPSVLEHLDNCLACMACERVCPSQVKYGELIATTRAWLRDTGAAPRGALSLGGLLAHPRLLGTLLRMANLPGPRRILQSRVMRALLRPFGTDRAVAELPRLPAVAKTARVEPFDYAQDRLRGAKLSAVETPSIPGQAGPSTSAHGAYAQGERSFVPRNRVGLFLGCVAASVDRDVHAASQTLLRALGYDVVLPSAQGCCGALALHNGDAAQAARLGETLRSLFGGAGVDAVLVSASGCFGTLRDHVFADSPVRVREIHEFLDADAHIGTLKFRPLAERIALHTPCTQRNVACADGAIARLLARIPQLQIEALHAPPGCCGAAGDYFLHHPETADALRAQTLDSALATQAQSLVTSNVGCRIFLANGLRERTAGIPVMHPVVLLARQLEN
ncbi:MAG: (Fe-S)-binding protein [Xanthomonadaceae bacterium]|nr:(Fe-S)-binding protein [Xanthomonadaceae bacterium]MDE1960059.1 (Fe-S)-binding protein [Xanthomonadaceae bacterium]MDE2083486.1 (Fe-S)-binding protein [Xanthomonadaceae bacterium]MDE2257423.1 (Fe-S)-binding protein [Xanthomonadaceae bacterium]